MDNKQLTTKDKPIRLDKKKLMFMDNWTNPDSKTFGNVYRSGINAGFSPSYSRNLTHLAPKWLSAYIDKLELSPEHIKQGVQNIATKDFVDSRSVDDTRLKAYETLAKLSGMMNTNNNVTVNVVQPILAGMSVQQPKKVDNTVIDQDT
jgi:hypothetical protein